MKIYTYYFKKVDFLKSKLQMVTIIRIFRFLINTNIDTNFFKKALRTELNAFEPIWNKLSV